MDYNFNLKSLPSSDFLKNGLRSEVELHENWKKSSWNFQWIPHYNWSFCLSIPNLIFHPSGYSSRFVKKMWSFFKWYAVLTSISGRMGMLITHYLIQMNTYNSVKAPPKRGFSSIEEWFVGMQAPILIAILEYGILLALKKFFSQINIMGKHFNLEMIFKRVDLFSFLACTIYIYCTLYHLIFQCLRDIWSKLKKSYTKSLVGS